MPDTAELGKGQALKLTRLLQVAAAGALLLGAMLPAWAVTGTATFYSDKFDGRRTASSEQFDQDGLTAAHHSLPFGSEVKVTNLRNGRSVVVRVNDRMNRRNRNVIDVSRRAARELGFVRDGRASVQLEVLR